MCMKEGAQSKWSSIWRICKNNLRDHPLRQNNRHGEDTHAAHPLNNLKISPLYVSVLSRIYSVAGISRRQLMLAGTTICVLFMLTSNLTSYRPFEGLVLSLSVTIPCMWRPLTLELVIIDEIALQSWIHIPLLLDGQNRFGENS